MWDKNAPGTEQHNDKNPILPGSKFVREAEVQASTISADA